MDAFIVSPGQIIFGGHNLSRALAIASAREHLVTAKQLSEFDADDLLVDMPNRVVQAWWDDQAGIVQSDYPNARPVTVVNIPTDKRVFDVEAQKFRRSQSVTSIN